MSATNNNANNGQRDVNLESANSLRNKALEGKTNAEKQKLEEQVIGSNGYALGQKFTISGAAWVTRQINGATIGYAVFTTEEGAEISIKQVMGISSLVGYETSGSFPNESGARMSEKTTEQVTAQVVEDFKFSDVFQPSTRKFLDFLDIADRGEFNGRTLTYLGVAVRPFVAKTNSSAKSSQEYTAGMQRTITVKLWGMSKR